MKTKPRCAGAAILMLFGLSCTAYAEPSSAVEFLHELEASFPDYMELYNVPGMSISFIEDGEIVYSSSFGFADRDRRIPMTNDTLYQVASISKNLTAWGVMRLVDEGLIGLDDPVEQYLSRWHIPPSPYDSDGVTARRLLNHTAGISLNGYGAGIPVNEELPSIVASLGGDTRGCGAVALVREPGTAMAYSGGGYSILQLLVEEVTGQSFAQYMKDNVLDPLGLTSSTFTWDERMQSKLSCAYGAYYNTIANQTYIEDAAGGLYSSLDDMTRYAQAILDGPAILSEDSFRLLFAGDHYGLGHGLIDFPEANGLFSGEAHGWAGNRISSYILMTTVPS